MSAPASVIDWVCLMHCPRCRELLRKDAPEAAWSCPRCRWPEEENGR